MRQPYYLYLPPPRFFNEYENLDVVDVPENEDEDDPELWSSIDDEVRGGCAI